MPLPDAYVLAGGLGSRMGADKALVALGGRSLLARVVAALCPVAGQVTVVRRSDQVAVPFPTLVEPDDERRHPLLGIAAALRHAESELVLLAPTDVPFVPTDVFAQLVARGPAVVACEGHVYPLLAVLPRSWATRAAELAERQASARSLVDGLPTIEVARALLAEANTPDELRTLLSRA